jgi:hypothetical protein
MNAIAPVSQVAPLAESPPLVIQEGAAALMAAIIQFASNPAMDLDKFERLIALQERAEDRQAERAYNAAFVRLQGRLPRIKRDGSLEYPTDKTKTDGPKRPISKYAKWETIDAGIRPILTEEGIGLSFRIAPRIADGGGLNVSAVLRHIGGYKDIGDPFPVSLDTSGGKNNAQAYGSSLSYGKKYAAFAALNIITEGEDTDGRTPTEDGEINSREHTDLLYSLLAKCSADPTAVAANERGFLIKMGLAELRSLADAAPRDFARIKNALLTKKGILANRAATQTQNRDTRP